jgi:hypothetical protein
MPKPLAVDQGLDGLAEQAHDVPIEEIKRGGGSVCLLGHPTSFLECSLDNRSDSVGFRHMHVCEGHQPLVRWVVGFAGRVGTKHETEVDHRGQVHFASLGLLHERLDRVFGNSLFDLIGVGPIGLKVGFVHFGGKQSTVGVRVLLLQQREERVGVDNLHRAWLGGHAVDPATAWWW